MLRKWLKANLNSSWWKLLERSWKTFLTLIPAISIIVVIDYFNSKSEVKVELTPAFVIVDVGKFRKNKSAESVIACVSTDFPEISSALSGGKNLFLLHYLEYKPNSKNKLSQWFLDRKRKSEKKNKGDGNDFFSTKNLLSYAKSIAGYGPQHMAVKTDWFKDAWSSPIHFNMFLMQYFDIDIIPMSTTTSALYRADDLFPACIEKLPSDPEQTNAYYSLRESREVWNPILLNNDSPHTNRNILFYFPGMIGGLEKIIWADGGEIIQQNNSHNVVRYSAIPSGSSKLILVKTSGRKLEQKDVSIEYEFVRSISTKWLITLCLLGFLFSLLYWWGKGLRENPKS